MKTRSKAALAALILLAAAGGAALVIHLTAGADSQEAVGRRALAAPSPIGPTGPAARTEPRGGPADARPLALVSARAELDPAARQGAVEGRVVNWSTGAPVAGAEVALALDDAAATAVATDREGRFRFEPDRAGRVVIASITAVGFLPFAPEWGHSPIELVARPGVRVRDVVIYLTPAIDYTGRVLDAGGKPVAGARVRIIDLPAGEQELIDIPDRFTSDREGRFVFHAPDFALLEARAGGHGPGRARLDGRAQTSHQLVIRLAPAGGPADALGTARISGQVVDGGGDPLPGVLVRAEPAEQRGEEDELVAAARAVTGDDGRFALSGLDAGRYRLEARDGARAPAEAEVEVAAGGAATARLTMAAGAVLRGTVVDAGGEPVPAFTVVVFRGEGLGNRLVAMRTFIDRAGAFAVEGLAAGSYRVQASAHGHAPSPIATGRAVEPPARGPEVDIALPAGGTLTGLVKSARGGPLGKARVSVEGGVGDGATPIPFAATAVTGEDGRFTLTGLAPGRRSVVIGAYAHHGTILGGLEISEGAVIGPVEVVLNPVAEGEEPTVELAGIGAVLAPEGDTLLVQRALPGGGAEKAGLAPGDAIVSVDGAPVTQLGFDQSIQAIRGPVGSSVRLGVVKAGADRPVEVVVERVKIRA